VVRLKGLGFIWKGRERNREGGSVGGKEKSRGSFAKQPSSSSLLRFRTERRGEPSGWPAGGAGGPCTAAAEEWGKMERRPRGSQPRAYLGLRWFVGAAPREEAAVGMGLTVVARCDSVVRQWRGGDGSVVRRDRRGAINSRSKAVRGKIFVLTGALAGSWWPVGISVAERRDGSGGDGTARPGGGTVRAEAVEGGKYLPDGGSARRGRGDRSPGEVTASGVMAAPALSGSDSSHRGAVQCRAGQGPAWRVEEEEGQARSGTG
jgi:hypothetical protein